MPNVNDGNTEPMQAVGVDGELLPDDLSIVAQLNKRRAEAGMVPLFGPASPVDLEGFIRSQMDFVQAMIRFHNPRRMPGDNVYLEELTLFSKAQTGMIMAMYRLFDQIGIL